MREQKFPLLRPHGAQKFIPKVQVLIIHVHPRISDNAAFVAGEPNQLESLSNTLCHSVQTGERRATGHHPRLHCGRVFATSKS